MLLDQTVIQLLLWRHDKLKRVIQSHRGKTPHSIFGTVKHGERVAVMVAGAEISVATVLGLT